MAQHNLVPRDFFPGLGEKYLGTRVGSAEKKQEGRAS